MNAMNIPQIDFYFIEDDATIIETTKDLFLGKRTVLFCVPGAFTPVSTSQLLGFEEAFGDIKDLGVDQVLCVSVNDGFVMNAWEESAGTKNVLLFPDGNGYFTQGLKAVVAKENMGMGLRSWRIAFIINENGVVEWASVEDGQRANASDDPYEKTTPNEVIIALKELNANNEAAEGADTDILAQLAAAGISPQ
jgi:peroxiredoxin